MIARVACGGKRARSCDEGLGRFMRFDAERIEATRKHFAYPRAPGTEGEQRALGEVAAELERAGWIVGRVRGRPFDATLLLRVLGAGLLSACITREVAVAHRALLVGAAFLAGASIPLLFDLAGWWMAGRPSRILFSAHEAVIAAKPADKAPAARVLFLTTATAIDRGERDNSTGLALLLELARAWPQARSGRVEACFGAFPLHGLDKRRFAERLSAWPACTTLVVMLERPGVGPEIAIAERPYDPNGLARAAARDLRLPHRDTWLAAMRNRVLQLPGATRSVYLGSPGRATRHEPGVLLATLQLAAELALRWGKMYAETAAYEEGKIVARSSQNPG